ncbi:MAG: hypothetical protein ACRCX2_39250 [Paraclostridium sp.]
MNELGLEGENLKLDKIRLTDELAQCKNRTLTDEEKLKACDDVTVVTHIRNLVEENNKYLGQIQQLNDSITRLSHLYTKEEIEKHRLQDVVENEYNFKPDTDSYAIDGHRGLGTIVIAPEDINLPGLNSSFFTSTEQSTADNVKTQYSNSLDINFEPFIKSIIDGTNRIRLHSIHFVSRVANKIFKLQDGGILHYGGTGGSMCAVSNIVMIRPPLDPNQDWLYKDDLANKATFLDGGGYVVVYKIKYQVVNVEHMRIVGFRPTSDWMLFVTIWGDPNKHKYYVQPNNKQLVNYPFPTVPGG